MNTQELEKKIKESIKSMKLKYLNLFNLYF